MDPENPGANDSASDSASDSPAENLNQDAELDNQGAEDAEDQDDDQAGDGEEDDEDSDDADGDGGDDDDSKLPFHKHPRWIKQQQENKRLKDELAKARNGEGQDKPTQVKPKSQPIDTSNVSKMFEGLPERKMKDKYTDWNEAYKDFRTNLMADLLDLRGKQKDGDEALVNQYDSQLNSIKKQLGDERFKGFVSFAHEALAKHSDASLEFLYDWYSKNAPKTQTQAKPKLNKPVSKVNKSGAASQGGAGSSEEAPDADYLRNHSFGDILQDQMNKAKK
jgi:hypothetical protein